MVGQLWGASPSVLFDGVAGSAGSAGVLERILQDSLAARGTVVSGDSLVRWRERGDCSADRSQASVAKCLQRSKFQSLAWVQAGPVQQVFSRIVWFPLVGRRSWTVPLEATVATKDDRRSRRFAPTFVQALGFVGTAGADRFPVSSRDLQWAADSLAKQVSQELAGFLFADSVNGGSSPASP